MIISGPTAILLLISQHAAGICFIILILCTILGVRNGDYVTYLLGLSALSILAYLWLVAIRRLFQSAGESEGFFSNSNINDAIEFYGGFACFQILVLGLLYYIYAQK